MTWYDYLNFLGYLPYKYHCEVSAWLRAAVLCLYGNLTHALAFLIQCTICVLFQQTDQGVYHSTKVLSLGLVKL